MSTGPEQQALLHADLARADELGVQVREAYADLARRTHALIEASSALESELESSRARISASDAERQAQAAHLARLQAHAAQQTLEIEQSQHELAQLQERLKEALARKTAAEGEVRTHLARIGDLQQVETSVRHELEFAREDAETLRRQVIEHQSRATELESERKELAGKLTHQHDAHSRASHELAQLKHELEEVQSRADARSHAERELFTEIHRLFDLEPGMAQQVKDLSASQLAHDAHGNHLMLSRLAPALAEFSEHWRTRRQAANDGSQRIGQLVTELEQSHEAHQLAERERDEIAAHGKEVISQLTGQRDVREMELHVLRNELTQSVERLDALTHLRQVAVLSVRRLGEACAQMAQSAGESHLDLESALTRLPDEGEEMAVDPEAMNDVAQAGVAAANALARRHAAQLVATGRIEKERLEARSRVEEQNREVERLRAAVQEGESAARRHQGEVTAVRREMAEQSAALGLKIQEHSQARAELVSMIADRDADRERISNHERRSQELLASLEARSQEVARLESSYAIMQKRCDAAEANQAAMAQALGSLTSWQPANDASSEGLVHATHKFELARGLGGDDLADAGRALAYAVQERSRALADRLSSAERELTSAAAEHERHDTELTSLRAALLDRDEALKDSTRERERFETQHQSLLQELMGAQKTIEALNASLEETRNQLRFALAEVDDVRARDQASSGYNAEELTVLRRRLGEHDIQARAQEALITEHKERHEAAEARLRRTREEFQRMLEERDHIIRDKDQLLDDLGARRVDVKGLEAQAVAMATQLAASNDRIKELETALGIHAGSNVKSLDLARELRRAQAERDSQRDRLRQLEGDLADALSQHTEAATQLDEKRKEVASLREQFLKESAEDREKTTAMREEFRRLKEEVVGLRARLRRLTETK
jgi:chromosome segregation ATPase